MLESKQDKARKILGGLICRHRNQMGISSHEMLAELAGVPAASVHNAEKVREAYPPANDLRRIVGVFDFRDVHDLAILDQMIENATSHDNRGSPQAVSSEVVRLGIKDRLPNWGRRI